MASTISHLSSATVYQPQTYHYRLYGWVIGLSKWLFVAFVAVLGAQPPMLIAQKRQVFTNCVAQVGRGLLHCCITSLTACQRALIRALNVVTDTIRDIALNPLESQAIDYYSIQFWHMTDAYSAQLSNLGFNATASFKTTKAAKTIAQILDWLHIPVTLRAIWEAHPRAMGMTVLMATILAMALTVLLVLTTVKAARAIGRWINAQGRAFCSLCRHYIPRSPIEWLAFFLAVIACLFTLTVSLWGWEKSKNAMYDLLETMFDWWTVSCWFLVRWRKLLFKWLNGDN